MNHNLALNKILVVDIETTCWDNKAPDTEESEIIEIGLAILYTPSTLDRAGLIIEQTPEIIVKPQRSTISKFCTKLTTLTQEQVDNGVLLSQAVDLLIQKYDSKNTVWASWGDFDRKIFVNNCSMYGIIYPFNVRHINIKTLFALTHSLKKEIGMAEALKLTGLPLIGTHHRGRDDAYNIAKLLELILWG